MASHNNTSTSAEMIAMHDRLVRDGFLAVIELPGGGSQLSFPQGTESEPVREYLRTIKQRGTQHYFLRRAPSIF
jgi:hypothetical protein